MLANNEIYHVFNRSVGKENIFDNRWYLTHSLELINYYRYPQKIRYSKFKTLPLELKDAYFTSFKQCIPLVDIYAFAFMPNHYHLLVKQNEDRGIYRFLSNFQNSFAKYFNLKNNRHGSVFQNSFKAKRVESDEDFMHISRYIHLNPVTSYIISLEKLSDYPWTSYPFYIEENKNIFINSEYIKEKFKPIKKYIKFVADQADYQKELHQIKNLMID